MRLLILCVRCIARGLGLGLGTLGGRLEGEVEDAALSCVLSVLLPSWTATLLRCGINAFVTAIQSHTTATWPLPVTGRMCKAASLACDMSHSVFL